MNINNEYASIKHRITDNRLIYAQKHKYIYIEVNHLDNGCFDLSSLEKKEKGGRSKATWSKPFVLKQIMHHFGDQIDFILWMDIDSLIYNCEISIESIINIPDWLYWINNHHQLIRNEQDYVNIIVAGDFRSVANNGIFLIHNTRWSLQFVSDWIDLAVCEHIHWEYVKPFWFDNVAFIVLLNGARCSNSNQSMIEQIMMERGKAHGVVHSNLNRSMNVWKSFLSKEMQQNVAILPQKALNAYQRQSMLNYPAFMHFAGMKNRTNMIDQWLNRSTCI